MHATAIITALFAATAFGRPSHYRRASQASTSGFQITDLSLHDVSNGNTSISFDVYDSNKLAGESATCTGSWKHNSSDYPTGPYDLCSNSNENSTFAWRMEVYNAPDDFTLGIEHYFTNPALGDPPYDGETYFGKAQVNTTNISCQGLGGQVACNQPANTTIYAPYYAITAKQR